MDSADRELLQQSIDGALASVDGDDTAAVDSCLAGLGWPDMFVEYPLDSIAVVFGALGRTNADSGALADVVGGGEADETCWARFALAHQLLGGADAMLIFALDHATEREQFGQTIGSFQAIQHKLADVFIATESAREALAAVDVECAPLSVDLARILAGRAAKLAAKHCQQVLAGIGFTKEHRFHRYLQRSMALDIEHGSTRAITRDVGAQLLDSGKVPTVVDL